MIVYAKATQDRRASKPAYPGPCLQSVPPVRRPFVDRLSHQPTGHHLKRHLPVTWQDPDLGTYWRGATIVFPDHF